MLHLQTQDDIGSEIGWTYAYWTRKCGGECYRKFATNLISTIILQTGAKPYQCSECGKFFACKDHLLNHSSFHSEPKKSDGCENAEFVCQKCGKTYQTERSLMVNRSYLLCRLSWAYFITLLSRIQFEQIHNSNMHKKPGQLQCSMCPLKFGNKKNLKVSECIRITGFFSW